MNRHFFIGFALGLLLFLAINLAAAHLASDCGLSAVFGRDACADDIARAGWPLRFHEEGGFAYRSNFNATALLLDLGVGLACAVLTGWIYSRRKNTPSK